MSKSFDDESLLFDEDFLFQDIEEICTVKTEDLPNSKTKDVLNTKSIKNRPGFNKPTEQWINRCNGDKDSYPSFIDVHQISKLLVSEIFNIFLY